MQARYSCRIAKGESPFSVLASRVILWNAERTWLVSIAMCCLKDRPGSNQMSSHLTTSFGSLMSLFGSLILAVLASFPVVKYISSIFARSN